MNPPPYNRAFFDALYAANPDPWDFRTSAYEWSKYAATVAVISDRRYAACLEIGCSIGELSARLAVLSSDFLGIDIAAQPLDAARARCADLPQARFECRRLPAEWPEGQFDLIVLSEVLYFFSGTEIRRTAARVRTSLVPGGRVLLVNWLGAPEASQPGDLAAETFIAASNLVSEIARRETLYRLDLLAHPVTEEEP